MGKKPKKPKRKPSKYNLHIGREMRAGKTMKQAAASWDKKRSKPKPKSGGSRRSHSGRSSSTTGGRRVGKGFNTQKMFSVIRTLSFVLPLGIIAIGPGTPQQKLNTGVAGLTGVDMQTKNFRWERMIPVWGPYIGANIMTRVVPKIITWLTKVFS